MAERAQRAVIKLLRARGSSRLPDLANSLASLSNYFKSMKRFAEAEPFSREALEICEIIQGPVHLETAKQLINHGGLLYCQRQLSQALPLYDRALKIRAQLLGAEHPDVLASMTQVLTNRSCCCCCFLKWCL